MPNWEFLISPCLGPSWDRAGHRVAGDKLGGGPYGKALGAAAWLYFACGFQNEQVSRNKTGSDTFPHSTH